MLVTDHRGWTVEVPRVSLCRGCCCGTSTKRPDTDHRAQLERFADLAARGLLQWRETDCLGPCEQADVLVVHPTPIARAGGARAVWLSRIGDDQLEAVTAWIVAGGPGRADVPAVLEPHRIPAYGSNT